MKERIDREEEWQKTYNMERPDHYPLVYRNKPLTQLLKEHRGPNRGQIKGSYPKKDLKSLQ